MSAEMQLQMRRNVEQANEAVADLGDWLNDIGKRDGNLRGVAPTGGGAGGGDETDEEEEAREIEAAKEELRRLSEAQEAELKKPAAAAGAAAAAASGKAKQGHKDKVTHAQKYGNWERYDADAVVKKLEEREADQERLRKEVVRLENARAQAKARKAQAAATAASEAMRLQGNEAFGATRYEEAVGLYTDALGHTPRSAVLYANRALALLKLGANAEAEEDCDAALLIDAGFVKAMLRRAQARHALEKYDTALDDLEAALEKEPRNGGARSLMAECRRLKAAQVPKPKPKLTRVKIEQLRHDADNDGDAFVEALAPPPPAAKAAEAAAAVDVSDGADGSAAAAAGTSAAASTTTTGGGSSDAASTSRAAAGAAKAVRSLPNAKPTADSFGTPSTLAEMERAWRSLRSEPDEFALLLQRIEPSRMQTLFKNNLPAELFSAILAAIDKTLADASADAARAVEVMRALTHAGRFSIMTMCLDKTDTKALASIFQKLEEAEAKGELPGDAALPALKKQYA